MKMRVAFLLGVLAALVPPTASAKTYETSFQLTQLTPSRVWAETSFIPDAQATPPGKVQRLRLGSRTFVGTWIPAAASALSTSEALTRTNENSAVMADRALTSRERRRFQVLVDLYHDADVLVVAAGHPACAGLTRAQARSIATGGITRWSAVVAGAGPDTIKVRYPTDLSGEPVPHLGAKWVKARAFKHRLTYAPRAVGARDGGVSAAASGDQAIAAITTWAKVRSGRSDICVVPLSGVAPTDATVAGLDYPEAFPVSYVVLRRPPRLDAVERARMTLMRRVMAKFLKSEKLKDMLRRQNLLVTGDPPPASV